MLVEEVIFVVSMDSSENPTVGSADPMDSSKSVWGNSVTGSVDFLVSMDTEKLVMASVDSRVPDSDLGFVSAPDEVNWFISVVFSVSSSVMIDALTVVFDDSSGGWVVTATLGSVATNPTVVPSSGVNSLAIGEVKSTSVVSACPLT